MRKNTEREERIEALRAAVKITPECAGITGMLNNAKRCFDFIKTANFTPEIEKVNST